MKHLGENKYLTGTLTYADFLFYETITVIADVYPEVVTPAITAFIHNFENLPGIKEYIAKPTVNLKVYFPPGKAAWSGPK